MHARKNYFLLMAVFKVNVCVFSSPVATFRDRLRVVRLAFYYLRPCPKSADALCHKAWRPSSYFASSQLIWENCMAQS